MKALRSISRQGLSGAHSNRISIVRLQRNLSEIAAVRRKNSVMSSTDKYTDPELREEVKEEVKAGDKGGNPGQWSARKAQMMASEYKKRGGEYTTDEQHKDDRQKHLDNWTAEEWQTQEGSGNAKQADGTEKRYLPKEAWEQMSEKEKEETEEKKAEGSREGKQFVGNTAEAVQARKNASVGSAPVLHEDSVHSGAQGENEMEKGNENQSVLQKEDAAHSTHLEEGADQGGKEMQMEKGNENESVLHKADSVHSAEGDQGDKEMEMEKHAANDSQDDKDKEMDGEKEGEEKSQSEVKEAADAQTEQMDDQGEAAKVAPQVVPQKRGSAADQQGSNKKQKGASDKEGPRGTPGDKSRVPQPGQKVQWKSLPGYVDGEVVEVAYERKTVEGKAVRATKDDPRVVLKSAATGKIAVHKPQAVYFE